MPNRGAEGQGCRAVNKGLTRSAGRFLPDRDNLLVKLGAGGGRERKGTFDSGHSAYKRKPAESVGQVWRRCE